MSRLSLFFMFLTFVTLGFVLDLSTKAWVFNHLVQPRTLIPGVLGLQIETNTGIAFGIQVPNALMIFITPFLLLLFFALLAKHFNLHSPLTIVSFSLITAGALGNLFDRIVRGEVIDFIKFVSWPTFNFADVQIVIGVALLMLFSVRIQKESSP